MKQSNGYIVESRYIVEQILGKILLPTAVIHHWDGNKFNNAPSNLLICQDQSYHMLIHWRMRKGK